MPTTNNKKKEVDQSRTAAKARKPYVSRIDRITGAVSSKGAATLGAEDLISSTTASGAPTTAGPAALRSSIADLYRLGSTLHHSYRYLSHAIMTTDGKNHSGSKRAKQDADNSEPTADSVTTDQIWGQLTLLGAPVLQDIGLNISKLSTTFGSKADAGSKKGDKKKGKKIAFDDEDEDDGDDLNDLDYDELAALAEEEDASADGDEDDDDVEDDDDDVEDSESDDDLVGDDPALAKLMASRSRNKSDKKSSMAAKRQKALMDFAAGGDDGENDEEEWAAEFETRNADDDDDEEAGGHDRKPKLSKRGERLQKKFGRSNNDDDDENDGDELGGFGDDGDDAGLYGDDDEEGEEGDDIMAEMYGDDYEGEDGKFMGEDEEDDDVHGTSDEEAEEGDDGELYDAEEDSRFQRGMFPTDNDDGFDNILDDREGAYHHGSGADGADGAAFEDDEEDYDGLTDFQIRQKQEQKFIAQLEQKRAFNADWAMTGEVEGRARPKDSLLDEELDFEHGMKSVPVITEALTAKLEERIKKRILDNNFNDVVRRQPTTSAADLTSLGVAKRDTTTDAEKSKASLMDLYEKDYLAKLKKMEDAAGMNENIAEPLTEVEKDELKAIQMWKRLAQHLDALSNYYFTPKPVQEDLNVRVRAVEKAAPAISMESVGAFAVSKVSAIAPQDTFRPSQKQMLGNVSLEEMTPRERQALRRSKKEASATTKARVEKQTADRKKRRVEIEASKSK